MKGRGRGGVCNFLFFRKIIPHPNPSPRVGRGAPFGSRRSFLKPFIIFDTPSFFILNYNFLKLEVVIEVK
jgi:hypothetical protein